MKKVIFIFIIMAVCLINCGCERTIVLFVNNCSGLEEHICDVKNKKLDCTFDMPTCENKRFVGWFDDKSKGNIINLDQDFNGNTTLFAHWEEETETSKSIVINEPEKETLFNITFNPNGGEGGQKDKISIKYGEELKTISNEIPTRVGYVFAGWYDNSNYKKGTKYYNDKCKPVKSYDLKKNVILYAGWKKEASKKQQVENKKYDVSFNLNGGNVEKGKSISINNEGNTELNSSVVPYRTGYKFMGWYDNSDYTKGKQYYDNNGNQLINDILEDLILYAGWEANKYNISFNLNGGESTQAYGALTVKYDEMLPTVNYIIPTRSGYTFTGWYDNTNYTKGKQYYDNKFKPVRTYDVERNLILYAGWSKVVTTTKYTVGFNINGGSGSVPKNVQAVLGKPMPAISSTIPTRSGYKFMGWYDNTDYTKGNQYYTAQNTSNMSYDKKSDTVLYAGWKKTDNTPSITATCTGEYENGYGLAKLNVNVTKGVAKNYRFISDNKTLQNNSNCNYKATSNFTLLINPKVEITDQDGKKVTVNCSVSHSNYITYNKKGYYFSKKASKDKEKLVDNPFNKNKIPYYLYVGPNVSPTDKLPLIIALHGGYGYECKKEDLNEKKQNNHYLKKALYYRTEPINNDKNADVRAVIVAPSSTTCNWEDSIFNAIEIMYSIIKLYNIDFDNILVTGSSQGGYGTLFLGFLEEHITYIASDNNTTLDSIAKEYGTTAAEVKEYNSILGRSIYYSDSKKTKLKSGKGVIIRAKNNNDQRSLFSVLIPMSPAKVYSRCAFTPSTIYDRALDGGDDNHKCDTTPPYDLKTPIWVISSNDENFNIINFSKELTAYYRRRGNIRYTNLTNLPNIGIAKHYTQNAIIGKTNAINWMLKQKYGKVNVDNNNELSAIEASLGSNFAGVWQP